MIFCLSLRIWMELQSGSFSHLGETGGAWCGSKVRSSASGRPTSHIEPCPPTQRFTMETHGKHPPGLCLNNETLQTMLLLMLTGPKFRSSVHQHYCCLCVSVGAQSRQCEASSHKRWTQRDWTVPQPAQRYARHRQMHKHTHTLQWYHNSIQQQFVPTGSDTNVSNPQKTRSKH